MAQRTIIEAVDIRKIYGMGGVSVAALDGVNLKIKEGEFVGIMGPSGSGKSTLLHILGCLSKPTSGYYILDGEDVSNLDKADLAFIRNKKIGFICQAYNLLARTTSIRNVILPLLYNRENHLEIEEMEAKALRLLEMVGLSDRVYHQPQELSGGEQQRVAVARALINDPLLIIADEPTGNLDTKSGKEIMDILHQLHDEGATIVVVTHDSKIAAHTERTIHLLDGKIEKIAVNGGRKKAKKGVK